MQTSIVLDISPILCRPERMVVAGVGVDHDRLVESVQKNFVEKPPIWGSESLQSVLSDRSVDFSSLSLTRSKSLVYGRSRSL
jgi:hypothetical protein